MGWVGGRFLHQFATGFAQWRPVQMQWPQSAPDRDGPRKEGTELVGTPNYRKLRCETFFIAATQLCQVYLHLCPHVGSITFEEVEPHRSEKSLDYNAQALQLWP